MDANELSVEVGSRLGGAGWIGRRCLVVALLILAACGEDQPGADDGADRPTSAVTSAPADEPPADPVGAPVLPNLVPAAPTVIHMQRDEDGEWAMRFTSVLVNVGDGDFTLTGVRTDGGWAVEQEIEYDGGGAERIASDAVMVWGGDGHEHWHVERVASYWLEPVGDDGEVDGGSTRLTDSKVGFCFFDSGRELERGPAEARYDSHGCGHEDASTFRMGLSPGWGDTYIFSLPGQSIDISDLPDGRYRLWAAADEQGWFRETTRDDNVTWAEIELGTVGDLRTALVVASGPEPE